MTAKNVEPTPGSLRTETLPPSSSASFRDSGRPEPGPLDPPLERALDLAELLEDPLAVLRGDADAGVGHREDDRVARARGGGDADLAALGELHGVGEEVPQDLRRACPRRCAAWRRRPAPRRRSATEPCASRGRIVPRRPSKRSATSNDLGRTTALPASTLARSSRSLTSAESPSAALRMKRDLLLLLGGQLAVAPVEQEAGQAQDRVQRRAELVAHVREEAGLQVRDPLQDLGVLVELGVEGDDAAVGLLQLAAVQLGELGLAVAQLLRACGCSSWFCCWSSSSRPCGACLRQLGGDPRQVLRRERRPAAWAGSWPS